MTTILAYPFRDFAGEIKPFIPGTHTANSLENISPSFPQGKKKIIEIVGENIYNLAMSHYNSENYGNTEETNQVYQLLNNLVQNIQRPMASFTFYHHFIFFVVKVSDRGVTIPKSADEQTAYKYQADEAKEKYIETAWIFADDLVNFLNQNATKYTLWTALALYQINQIVTYNGTYYKCTTQHTSTEIFEVAKWLALTKSEITFWEWTESEQYIKTKNILFNNYQDFNFYFEIDSSAAFYTKIRNLIQEVIDDEVVSRRTLNDIYAQLRYNNITPENENLLKIIKRAVAYETIARAAYRYDYYELPRPMRNDIANEVNSNKYDKQTTERMVKMNISAKLADKARFYFTEVERLINLKRQIDNYAASVEVANTHLTDKFISVL